MYVKLSRTQEERKAGMPSLGCPPDGVGSIERIVDGGNLQNDQQLTMCRPLQVELLEATGRIIDTVCWPENHSA